MTPSKKCRKCGADVPSNAPFGHCPQCLIALGFGPLPTEALRSFDGHEARSSAEAIRYFGDYEIIEEIARGGMGIVFKARQVSLNRVVALKVMLAGQFALPSFVRRFRAEAEAAARLEHPNIVPIYEIGENDDQQYFSMRYVEGGSLARRMAGGEFRVRSGVDSSRSEIHAQQITISRLIIAVARAVSHAHFHDVLHRDIKPSNILVDLDGTPLLTDFGIAKLAECGERFTASGSILGTLCYMAPEQARGRKVTPAADICSLGAVLYELLAGKPPFEAATPIETLKQVLEQEPRHPRDTNPLLDEDLCAITMKCLEKAPASRYDSAAALADELGRWTRREPIRARRPTVVLRTQRWIQRNRAVTVLLCGLLAGFVATLCLSYGLYNEAWAAKSANDTLRRVIDTYIHQIGEPTRHVVDISSEQLKLLVGQEANSAVKARRISAGVFVGANQMETILGYGSMFAGLEDKISTREKPVRIDMRLYLSEKRALEDLTSGRVTFARISTEQYVKALGKRNVPLLASEISTNYPAVIFTRSDSGITNLAGLNGRSLALWDEESTVSILAKSILKQNGLCRKHLKPVYVAPQREADGGGYAIYTEMPLLGYLDVQGQTVSAVLAENLCDAGVAMRRQFRLIDEKAWRPLATFDIIRCVWAGSATLDTDLRERLRAAILGWEPTARRIDLDRYTPGWEARLTSSDQSALEIMRKAMDACARFDECGRDSGVASSSNGTSTTESAAGAEQE